MTDGLLVLDKPSGMTSHDVVGRCRRVFSQRRVGHAGTLDPDATGVLLVGLGRATRLLQFLTGLDKSYDAEVVLGVATTTLDSGGDEVGRWDMSEIDLHSARRAAATLTGPVLQVPPMVSAIKIGGQRLHRLARQGVEVERPSRAVRVHRFEIRAPEDPDPGPLGGGPVFSVGIDCSSGTYIRTLAADLGAALGGGAHLRRLRRSAVGPWTLADATPLEQITPEAVRPPLAALCGMPTIAVAGDLEVAVGHGAVLERSRLGGATLLDGSDGPWAVLDRAGALLAVYQAHGDGRAKPVVVLAGEDR
ncbi:MAG: tRNA pseudouridine(55) synthase TruB [Acidimicrobiales bacterium]